MRRYKLPAGVSNNSCWRLQQQRWNKFEWIPAQTNNKFFSSLAADRFFDFFSTCTKINEFFIFGQAWFLRLCSCPDSVLGLADIYIYTHTHTHTHTFSPSLPLSHSLSLSLSLSEYALKVFKGFIL